MKQRHNPISNKLSSYMVIWVMLMNMIFYSCTEPLEPNNPEFVSYNGPMIEDIAGNWDFAYFTAVGVQDTSLRDTIDAAILESIVSPVSFDSIAGSELVLQVPSIDTLKNYFIYQRDSDISLTIDKNKNYTYSLFRTVFFKNPTDSLEIGIQLIENGILDIRDENMIIVPKNLNIPFQGSLLTGELRFAIIDYSHSANILSTIGEIQNYPFSDGSIQGARAYSAFQKL